MAGTHFWRHCRRFVPFSGTELTICKFVCLGIALALSNKDASIEKKAVSLG